MTGPLFYSPQVNRFFQVREESDGSSLCGPFMEYAAGAQSATYDMQHLSDEFIDKCELVVAIDQCEHAEYNGYGWKVKA